MSVVRAGGVLNVIALKGLPNVSVVLAGKGLGALVRRTFPITSPAPADAGALTGSISVKVLVLRSLVSVNVPFTVVSMPSVTPEPVLAIVRLSKVVEVL